MRCTKDLVKYKSQLKSFTTPRNLTELSYLQGYFKCKKLLKYFEIFKETSNTYHQFVKC